MRKRIACLGIVLLISLTAKAGLYDPISYDRAALPGCGGCDATVEVYVESLDPTNLNLISALKRQMGQYRPGKLSISYYTRSLIRTTPNQRAFPAWPQGVVIALDNGGQAQQRGISSYPAIYIEAQGRHAVVKTAQLDGVLRDLMHE